MELQIKPPKVQKKFSMETVRSSLEVPDLRPLFRRSTSPTIVLSIDEPEDEPEFEIQVSKSATQSPKHSNSISPVLTCPPSPQRSKPGSRKNSDTSSKVNSKSSSRKNSFTMCLSPNRSLVSSPETSPTESKTQFLSPDPSLFNLPKSKVKLLKKTASVKQLYNNVLQALRTISRSKNEILPDLTKTFFENILRDSEGHSGLQVTKVEVKDGAEFGRHFCSEVHAVDVYVKIKDESKEKEGSRERMDGNKEKIYKLIIKSLPQSEDARNFLQPSHTFEKEVQMYSTVFLDMASFVKSKTNIPLDSHESQVVDIPRCYYSRWTGEGSSKDDMIIMENLVPQGFVPLKQGDPKMNVEHAELTIREIAKFHAISLCMSENSPEVLLEKYPKLREDSLYREDTREFTNRTMTPVMASLAEVLRSSTDYSPCYPWFVRLAKNFHNIQIQIVQPQGQFAVICHGDLWWSNILYKYDQNDKPLEVKFIDFQSSRVSSLVTDLLAFTFTSLPSFIRRQHIDSLLKLYHSTFLASCYSLQWSKQLFSLEDLQAEFRKHLLFGFIEGIWYLDIVYQGDRPGQAVVCDDEESMEGEEQDQVETRIRLNSEEEWEAKELKEKEKLLFQVQETENQENYRNDFFTMLEDVLILSNIEDNEISIEKFLDQAL
ncbi:uncharacterized protein LOC111706347 isoform X3 [Eurytemora carolleeae]|uniref:uncharacterized protein LOC111706347 isoform X3 n=1 Tax=Eurytemora carolleeae TaxID=1294199 RepID=UPI000C7877CF|nr:uncharacterized protein LOC111706347 isoform X3 [Eurytemora carolleeae]|eukprot:XP_023334969.1 uncharacterized protein LOC111706347 isoform X3 [Eurytemora affinis]